MQERVEQRGNGVDDAAERKAYLEMQCTGKSQHQLDKEQHDDRIAYREKGVDGRDYLKLRQRIRWRSRVIHLINRENHRRNLIVGHDQKDGPLAWM